MGFLGKCRNQDRRWIIPLAIKSSDSAAATASTRNSFRTHSWPTRATRSRRLRLIKQPLQSVGKREWVLGWDEKTGALTEQLWDAARASGDNGYPVAHRLHERDRYPLALAEPQINAWQDDQIDLAVAEEAQQILVGDEAKEVDLVGDPLSVGLVPQGFYKLAFTREPKEGFNPPLLEKGHRFEQVFMTLKREQAGGAADDRRSIKADWVL